MKNANKIKAGHIIYETPEHCPPLAVLGFISIYKG
jgi:hypothetical protein